MQTAEPSLRMRHAHSLDYDRVLGAIDAWWGGRVVEGRPSHVFFSHFTSTSFVIESDTEMVAFLLGFLPQSHPDEAHIHLAGVHPDYRRLGLGRRLYDRFLVAARMHGREWAESVASPEDRVSIAFHRSLGFAPLRGDGVIGGVPVWLDYAGEGAHRVVFRRLVAGPAMAATGEHVGQSTLPPALSA